MKTLGYILYAAQSKASFYVISIYMFLDSSYLREVFTNIDFELHMYNWLVFAWKAQTNELYLAGRAILSLFDRADDEAADHEKHHYVVKRNLHGNAVLAFQCGLHLSIQTSALQNVIDLTATHICCPVLSIAIYFMLA